MNKEEKNLIEAAVRWWKIKRGSSDVRDLSLLVAVGYYQDNQKQNDISFLEEERVRLMFEYLRIEGRITELELLKTALPQEEVSRISKSIASKVKICDCSVGDFGVDGKRSVCVNCQGIRRENYYQQQED